jgi:hypothetical protein
VWIVGIAGAVLLRAEVAVLTLALATLMDQHCL